MKNVNNAIRKLKSPEVTLQFYDLNDLEKSSVVCFRDGTLANHKNRGSNLSYFYMETISMHPSHGHQKTWNELLKVHYLLIHLPQGMLRNFFYDKISLGWINRHVQLSKYYSYLLLHWQQINCRYNKLHKNAQWKMIASGYLYHKGDDRETRGETNNMVW